MSVSGDKGPGIHRIPEDKQDLSTKKKEDKKETQDKTSKILGVSGTSPVRTLGPEAKEDLLKKSSANIHSGGTSSMVGGVKMDILEKSLERFGVLCRDTIEVKEKLDNNNDFVVMKTPNSNNYYVFVKDGEEIKKKEYNKAQVSELLYKSTDDILKELKRE